jgi:hypothetical protein
MDEGSTRSTARAAAAALEVRDFRDGLSAHLDATAGDLTELPERSYAKADAPIKYCWNSLNRLCHRFPDVEYTIRLHPPDALYLDGEFRRQLRLLQPISKQIPPGATRRAWPTAQLLPRRAHARYTSRSTGPVSRPSWRPPPSATSAIGRASHRVRHAARRNRAMTTPAPRSSPHRLNGRICTRRRRQYER